MAGIWIFAEDYEHNLELIQGGKELAQKLSSKIVVILPHNSGNDEKAHDCIARGANEVLYLPPLAKNEDFMACIPLIVAEVLQEKPDIFLIGSSLRGKELAARIAARLNTGLCSDCISLELSADDQSLIMERLIFGGAAVQRVSIPTRPQMATIPPRLFSPAAVQEGRTGNIRELPPAPPSKVKILGKKTRTHEAAALTEARILLCVGRGVEKEEDLSLVRELADLLGAEIGCTRPISDEMHWLPEECCIGLSGIQVKPELYIGIGVSGQIQHITGIRDARIICSINNDENAPISAVSDYAILGDLYKVLPLMIEGLKKSK